MCYIVFIPYGGGGDRNEGRARDNCLLVGRLTSAEMGSVAAVVRMWLSNCFWGG